MAPTQDTLSPRSGNDGSGNLNACDPNAPKRSCTDRIFLLLFAAFFLGFVIIWGIAGGKGDVDRLLYGTNLDGKTCGQGDLADKKEIVYPRLSLDLELQGGSAKVDPSSVKLLGVCVKECPAQGDTVYTEDKKQSWIMPVATTPFFHRCFPVIDTLTTDVMECKKVAVDGKLEAPNTPCGQPPDFKKCTEVCVVWQKKETTTTELPAGDTTFYEFFAKAQREWMRVFGDALNAKEVIAGLGFGGAIVLGLGWLVTLQLCAGVIVWFCAVVSVLIFFVISGICYAKAGKFDVGTVLDKVKNATATAVSQAGATPDYLLKMTQSNLDATLEASESYTQEFAIAGTVFLFLGFIVMLTICSNRRAIAVATGVIKTAAQTMRMAPSLILLPILQAVTASLVCGMFAYCALLLMSAGDVVEADFSAELKTLQKSVTGATGVSTKFSTFVPDVQFRYLLFYCVFGILWTFAVVDAIFAIATSAAVSQIMWAKSRDKLGAVSCCANRVAWRGVYYAFRYHVGTAAFGGLLIAIIQCFRLAFEWFHRQFKATKAEGTAGRIKECFFCIVRCILACLEKCVEFISHNAYALTAIQGRSFCSASKKAVSLMIRNAARFMAVEWFSKCVVILSRLLIVFGASLACWVTVEGDARYGPGGELELTTPWTPTVLTGVAAWFVAYGLTDVYDEALTAVFMVFLLDEETMKLAGKGNYKPVCGRGLRKYVSTRVLERAQSNQEQYENPMVKRAASPGAPITGGGGGGGGGGGRDAAAVERPKSVEMTSM